MENRITDNPELSSKPPKAYGIPKKISLEGSKYDRKHFTVYSTSVESAFVVKLGSGCIFRLWDNKKKEFLNDKDYFKYYPICNYETNIPLDTHILPLQAGWGSGKKKQFLDLRTMRYVFPDDMCIIEVDLTSTNYWIITCKDLGKSGEENIYQVLWDVKKKQIFSQQDPIFEARYVEIERLCSDQSRILKQIQVCKIEDDTKKYSLFSLETFVYVHEGYTSYTTKSNSTQVSIFQFDDCFLIGKETKVDGKFVKMLSCKGYYLVQRKNGLNLWHNGKFHLDEDWNGQIKKYQGKVVSIPIEGTNISIQKEVDRLPFGIFELSTKEGTFVKSIKIDN